MKTINVDSVQVFVKDGQWICKIRRIIPNNTECPEFDLKKLPDGKYTLTTKGSLSEQWKALQ